MLQEKEGRLRNVRLFALPLMNKEIKISYRRD